MDYREIVETLEFLAINAKLSGTEARVIVFMAARASYKTGEFFGSYQDIAKVLGVTKQAVMSSIKYLEKIGAIKKLSDQVGRTPAIYKTRSINELKLMYETEVCNPEFSEWCKKYDALFSEFDEITSSINDGCTDCTDDNFCEHHLFLRNRRMDTPAGRAKQIWESDNPKPEYKIKVIRSMGE